MLAGIVVLADAFAERSSPVAAINASAFAACAAFLVNNAARLVQGLGCERILSVQAALFAVRRAGVALACTCFCFRDIVFTSSWRWCCV